LFLSGMTVAVFEGTFFLLQLFSVMPIKTANTRSNLLYINRNISFHHSKIMPLKKS